MLKSAAFWTTFGALFLAEMGDKTQLAAITLAAQTRSPLSVFLGASLALVLVSLIGVAVGSALGQYLPARLLHKIAAIAFILIGVLMLCGKL
jgi:putative Ca2+/H+ antiporter (TMEM165/GDT1 family)